MFFLQDHFGDCVTKAVKFVEKMTEADLKQKVGQNWVYIEAMHHTQVTSYVHEGACDGKCRGRQMIGLLYLLLR